jgi:CheY-like chemotaxis protein
MAYHILVVEDDLDTRDLMEFMLRFGGHRVDVAPGGHEALELLAVNRYDVILCDWHMPWMSGEDLYRRIEQDWPHLAPRVVFVTAAATLAAPLQARDGGRSVPVLTKPYTPERLLQAIADTMA